MAGAEGGIGNGPRSWWPFWICMAVLVIGMVVGITVGEHFGWIH